MKRSVDVVEVELVGVSLNGFGSGFDDGFINCNDGFIICDIGFIICADRFMNPIDKFVPAKPLRTYTNIYALVTRSSR